MSAMTNRFCQSVFLDDASHEIVFEWFTGPSGGVMNVIKVSREDTELKGIALFNFWSMLNLDNSLSVTVVPNIQNDDNYDRY